MPLLAETVALAAGASSLGITGPLVSGAAGAVLYAVAGAAEVGPPSRLLVFGAGIAIAAVLWLVGRRMQSPGAQDPVRYVD